MNWLSPITLQPPPRRVVLRKKDGAVMPDNSRSVEVMGVRYHSMAEACRVLGWSYSRVYNAIGEGWRCGYSQAE